MKAADIISEIKGLPPQDFAEVSAYMLAAERNDPALSVALQRQQASVAGQPGVPYAQSRVKALASLDSP
jgi:hypothetical protein